MDQIPATELAPILVEAAKQGTASKYVLVSLYTLFVYDNITTLADEVELIWKRKFSAVTFLFIMNRYYTLAVSTVADSEVIFPIITPTICKRMILFQPLATGIPLTFFPNFVIALRVYALYERNKYLAAMLITYLLGEFGLALWVYLTPSIYAAQLPGPENVTNSMALHVCLAYHSRKLSSFQSASFQFMQTAFDSWVLVLVLFKSAREFFGPRSQRGLRSIIAAHGVIYYVVVFSVNIAWALMLLLATPGLQYIMAGPVLALAPLAANKLTLSLRGHLADTTKYGLLALEGHVDGHRRDVKPRMQRRRSWVGTSTFEVPVYELETIQFDNSTCASSSGSSEASVKPAA